MAITNEQIQRFVSNNEALEKAKSMDIDTFKNSLGEFGLEGVTPQEAETVKKLIDFAVKKSNELNEEALDMAAGGISNAGVGAIVGAVAGTAGIGLGILGKTLWNNHKLSTPKGAADNLADAAENHAKVTGNSILPSGHPTANVKATKGFKNWFRKNK